MDSEHNIELISKALLQYDYVMVAGKPRIGKTALAIAYHAANPLLFKRVIYVDALAFTIRDIEESFFTSGAYADREVLVIIDGVNEVSDIHDYMKTQVIKLVVDKCKKMNVKILAFSRLTNMHSFIRSFFRIHLEEDPHLQAINLITFNTTQSIDSIGEAIKREIIADSVKLSPKAQLNIIELMNRENLSSADIAKLIDTEIIYKDNVEQILEISKHTFLIDTSEVISDISRINYNILELVKKKPLLLHQITPRQFEELVAEMFYKDGFDVTLTPQTRDNGKDLMIIQKKRFGNLLIYVECKNYSPQNPVGVRLVRELYGTVTADRANAGILITSSYFSAPAIQFAEQVKSQVSLFDYYQLKQWLNEL